MYATKNAKTKTAVESRGVQAQILLGLVFLSRWFPQPFFMNNKYGIAWNLSIGKIKKI